MAAPLPTVFLSYRRNVSSFIARAVFQDLRQHGYDVFMDVESIDSGQFETIILAQIAARVHFLVILTYGTLDGCQEPDDWVRREIECAMELRRNIVPILVDDFRFDDTARPFLTGRLRDLSGYNGLGLSHDYFDAAMERLRKRFLTLPAQGMITPAPPHDTLVIQQKIEEAASQPAPTKQELSAEAYFDRGFALHDHSDEEMAYYAEALRLNPQYVEAYYNRGVAREARGDLAGAIADYTEAIRLYPLHASFYNNRGNVRRKQGDPAGAIADCTEALRLNPLHAGAYNNRGTARAAQGDPGGAIADYTEAIRLNPLQADAYYNRGNARRDQDDLAGATADYTEAIRLNPLQADAYYNRGNVRRDQGDPAGAIADYTEAIRLNPQDANAYNNRGNARRDQGDPAGATADYTEAIRLNPQDATAYYNRGLARWAQGDPAGAIADYSEAIRLNPQYVEAYNNRGVTRTVQGDSAGAIADYEKYLVLGGERLEGKQVEVEQRIRALRAQLDDVRH